MAAAYCAQRERSGMGQAVRDRVGRAPFAIQRDVWCNPHKRLTIEEVVGNPQRFQEQDDLLADTEMRTRPGPKKYIT